MPDPLPFRVRRGQPADADTLAEFNTRMASETEGVALAPDLIGPGVAAALADEAKAIYFVAEAAGQVVGQLMVTHEWSDWRNGDIWWIQSVYVTPAQRGRGVFAALYRHVEQLARQERVAGLRLYVEKENLGAQQSYGRLGMSMTHYNVMEQMFEGA